MPVEIRLQILKREHFAARFGRPGSYADSDTTSIPDSEASYRPPRRSPQDYTMAEDGDEEEDFSTPPGVMDEETKLALEKARLKVPRYLFRAWNGLSGGYRELNTTEAITPLAFSKHASKPGHSTAYDMTKDEFDHMSQAHLCTRRDLETEFSSWAASFYNVLWKASAMGDTAHISVIDTSKLPKSTVIIHVPDLLRAIHPHSIKKYEWEYLAHGVIKGPTHVAVSHQLLIQNGLDQNFTKEEVGQARRIASLYGSQFIVPITVALICVKRRSPKIWQDGWDRRVEVVAAGLEDLTIPQVWCQDASILTDVVYTEKYPEIELMIRTLRALVDYRYERGARERVRSLPLDVEDKAGEPSQKRRKTAF